MTEETNPEQLSDEEATLRIARMFEVLDAVYNLHSPNQSTDVWTCDECNGVQWPCNTEKLILEGLGL